MLKCLFWHTYHVLDQKLAGLMVPCLGAGYGRFYNMPPIIGGTDFPHNTQVFLARPACITAIMALGYLIALYKPPLGIPPVCHRITRSLSVVCP